jgi:long-chain acyl-CoA synthetase
MQNVYELVRAAAERFPERPAVEVFRRAGLDTYTYRDVLAMAEGVTQRLAATGISAGDRCAILAENDARWCAACLGIWAAGAVAVPLDTSYTANQTATILNDSGARIVFTTSTHVATAERAATAVGPTVTIERLADLTDFPHDRSDQPIPRSTDPAVILYTSGTTSDPKGVVLTHGNLLAERDAALQVVRVNEDDRILGVLPLFHALALIANLLLPLTTGARVVFLETLNSSEMMRALQERQITAFCVVPQFFYLLHQRVVEQLASRAWAARLVFRILKSANGWMRARLGLNAGRLLFRPVHAALGGRMRIMVTGGSRFDPAVGRDLYRLGLDIVQAYGLTECSGAATVTRPGDPHIDTVGPPLAGVEVRIADTPEVARGEHRDGEVLISGPIVMAGYHNRPDATAAALRDGWLQTGDLGYFDRDGRLRITGRKKEIIVLASGKNIYPEEIEAVYAQSPYVSEICVLGVTRPDDPSSERLHAVVVPNFELMRERGIVNTREIVRFDIEGLALQLPHHKRVLSFDLWREPLPRTTTRKLKRHEIERLYDERAESTRESEQGVTALDDAAWTADPHAARVVAAIRSAAKPGAVVAPDANLELDLGLDSMERVELLVQVEQISGVAVPDAVGQRIYTVRELVEATRRDGAQGGDAAPAVDPWAQLLANDPDDPAIRALLEPKPLLAPLIFAAVKIFHALAWLLLGLRVQGRANIPARGPYILSPNHQGYLDSFLLVSSLPYRVFRRLFFVGASEYFATPLSSAIARRINVVPVDPDVNLVRAMQAGAFGLRHEKVLVLFPEGERSPDGTPRTFKKGAAILSSQLGVPIVPVAIHGVFDVWPRGSGIRWRAMLPWAGTRTTLRFGTAIEPAATAAGAGVQRYSALTAALRSRVVAMWKEAERSGRV